jgi:hypothetical protein
VQERCTCGAILPEDALFCHKCGKPQREILAVETEAPPPAPPPIPAAAAPPPIGFHNGLAVRIGLLAAVLTIVVSVAVSQLGALRYLSPVWPVAAGFWTVFVYKRRTGQRLSLMNGAHLGWISGFFAFLIITVLLTIFVVMVSDPSFVSLMREQWKHLGLSDADINQTLQTIRTPANIAAVVVNSLLLLTVLPAFGGAIGAKLLDRGLGNKD